MKMRVGRRRDGGQVFGGFTEKITGSGKLLVWIVTVNVAIVIIRVTIRRMKPHIFYGNDRVDPLSFVVIFINPNKRIEVLNE